jgi:hypothetical protein
MKTAVYLSEVATERMSIACPKCGLAKSFDVAKAILLRGDWRLTDILGRITRDCPRKGDMTNPCSAVFTEVVLKPGC